MKRPVFPVLFFFSCLILLVSCGGRWSLPERLEQAGKLSPVEVSALLGLGTFVSEDLSCVSGGVLAAREVLPYWLAALGCFLGIWISDLGLYGLGRLGGLTLLRRRPFCWWIRESRVRRGEQVFLRHGGKLVFTSRFLPGSRVPVYVAAGVLNYSFWRFAAWMAVAGAIWTSILVGFAFKLGDALLDWLAVYEKAVWLILLAVILVVWLCVQLLESLFTHRGRRLLVSKWSRLTEWEFWPMAVFYPPVIAYILWLGIKHRGFTVFTLANPGIPQGGLAQESKADILKNLRGGSDREERVARFELIAESGIDDRVRNLEAFQSRELLDFPLVIKPDIGERGQGVAIVRSPDEARTYLESCRHPVIAQEFVPGLEFGVFYFRYPGADRGEILSITEKTLPTVTGDGERTLEQLLLDDSRAVKMAKFFLRKWANCLGVIPAKGEIIRLTDLGTHCRGAVFRDGFGHATESLLDAVESLSRKFEGFYFGRYDIRVPSIEDLEAGRGFKVLELNGVSSESTHIYEPGRSLIAGYRDLFKQWRIAFEIGESNRRRGGTAATIRELWQVIRAHRRHEWFETPPVAMQPPPGEKR